MVTRDAHGSAINQGDVVMFALATGQIVPAKLVQVQTLVPNQPPIAFLAVQVIVPIQPDGVIPGIMAAPKKEEKLISG